VGNDEPRGPEEPMIATPILDDYLAPKSAMDTCIEKESKRLIDEIGSKTIDMNVPSFEQEEKERADKLLESGYCVESVYGREFCASYIFERDSVVAVDIRSDLEHAAASALACYRVTGICNPSLLGQDFCKVEKGKWLINPVSGDAKKYEFPMPKVKPVRLLRRWH
jgi:hypothetical protein